MSRKFVAIRNSLIGLCSQSITILFAFVTRSIFIHYVGLELLGVNSTFTSVLSALSLSELGFETAVVYSLYRPIYDNDLKKINDIINILKVVYRTIGIIFIACSFAVLPFIKYIIVDVKLDYFDLGIYFLLQASATAASYFLTYKRTLLYAKQKEYIYKTIDMVFNCLLNILQCIMLVVFRSYSVYLILKFMQVVLSNLTVHVYCTKKFQYLHKDKINKNILGNIVHDVKNIFVGKIAGFIYASTDSIVISVFVNTVSVAYYGNYTTIVYNLKNLTTGLLAPIAPIVGNFFVEEENNSNRENIFLLYTHIRFWLSLLLVVPLIVLLNYFIGFIWLGESYILPISVTYLLAADFYIHLVHSASVDYINGMGLFKTDKHIELLGAMSNIIFSVFLVQRYGISGVIGGTVLSQSLFWVGRSAIVYFQGMHLEKKQFGLYWMRNLYYLCIFLLCTWICNYICKYLFGMPAVNSHILKFIAGGVISEFCIILIGIIMLLWMKEQKWLFQILWSLKKNIRKNR